ncbi:filamin-A-like isoform X4 [Dinothrombium tinctorium]|uniref:Filamin-A-like isoform X4 n=1 Tax=Dinothrombium tinctorium TaxID=1965070 RepID=A0A3S3R340_9ACAR|nr:filamin-A-like isoform X4 [Dinothrombium tinctorium]
MTSVLAIGAGLVSGRTNSYNDFTVYTHKPGYAGLSVGIDGPSRADIKYSDNHDGTVKVSYMCSLPGEYRITIKYDGLSVKGSPYTVRIRGDEPSYSTSSRGFYDTSDTFRPKVGSASRVRVSGRGLYSGITNVQNEVEIDVKDAGPGRLHWSIEGPGHVESRNRQLDNGLYKLYYKPDSPGEYQMRIEYDNREMASLVIATGSGLISGVPNTYNDFNAYINGFGIGGLSVNVDGPSRCDVRFKDFRDGNVKVSYLPTSPGEYRISVKYDGLAIRGSPFKVIIRGQQPRKYIPTRDREETMYRFQAPQQRAGPVRASGRGLFTGIVNIPNEVIVDVSEAAPGRLTWTVEGPAHVEARTSRLENGIYRLYYKPFASGDYTIRIKYAERDIIGSPFHVRVL